MARLQSHELRIDITPDDLPQDGFSNHVNNARYFAFINQTFHGWYVQMGIRGGVPGFAAVMAHLSYDFLREVFYPGTVTCKITVTKVGVTSIEHLIEIWDIAADPVLAGHGKAVHVWLDRASKKATPWPQQVLEKCWRLPLPAVHD